MGITFTRKGYIQVLKDGVVLSSHIQEREAIESLSEREDGDYVIRYPDVAVSVILRKSDTTPPAVPSGFSASAATATSVTLTLTANVESDFSNYVLERSSDNIGWGYLKSFSGTSTTDTVDISGSVYYYRVFALDTRGNRSAYTGVKSAGPYTQLLEWTLNLPDPIQLVAGGAPFVFTPYYSDPLSELSTIQAEDGAATESVSVPRALPSGVTIETGPHRLVASAGATIQTVSGYRFRLNTSAESSWLSRSTASGVFYSNNFTYKDAAKTQLIANLADLVASASQTGSTAKIAWDTSLKLSGNGCLRFNMAGGVIDGTGTGWTFSFDGIGLNTKNTVKTQFYIQFAYYADSVQNNFNYGGVNNYGGKIIIVEAPDQTNDSGEVVFRRWVEPGGFVGAYSMPVNQMYYNQVTSQSRGLLNNLYDANHYGGSFPTPSTASQWKQRHGYMSIGTVSDPDYVNAPRIQSNTWMVVEMYIDLVNDCVKIWMAPYGQSPKLIIGKNPGNGDLPPVGTIDDPSGANPKPLYTGAQLTNYCNVPTAWPSTDTFVCYDEIIASDNPIEFPGGFSLPFPGTDTVTGWPWTGTVFRG